MMAFLEFEGEDSNPLENGSKEFDEWRGGWNDAQMNSYFFPISEEERSGCRLRMGRGDVEIMSYFSMSEAEFSDLRSCLALEKRCSVLLDYAPGFPESEGIAAMLSGQSRSSNPLSTSADERPLWDAGWLKGCWLKGRFARILGEPAEACERVVRLEGSPEFGPLPPGSEERAAWLAGWESEHREQVALREARTGRQEDIPDPWERSDFGVGQKESEAGAREKSPEETRELLSRTVGVAGQRAHELGATRCANPHPPGSEEAASWLGGWEEALRMARIEDQFGGGHDRPPEAEGAAGAGRLEALRAAAQKGTDASVKGDLLESNPFEFETREWRAWKRSWRITEDIATGVYEDAAELPEDYDEDDREGNAKRAAAEQAEQDRFEADMEAEWYWSPEGIADRIALEHIEAIYEDSERKLYGPPDPIYVEWSMDRLVEEHHEEALSEDFNRDFQVMEDRLERLRSLKSRDLNTGSENESKG